MLVLACKEKRCVVETTEIDGKQDYKLVRPVSSTNEENMSINNVLKSYKYTLSGKIEYYPIPRQTHVFDGYIKLESDPKGERLSYANVVQRGSKLKSTDWCDITSRRLSSNNLLFTQLHTLGFLLSCWTSDI